MGLCCSKRQPQRPSPPDVPILKLEKKAPVEEAITEKKQVFVIAQTVKKPEAVAGSFDDVNRKGNAQVKKAKKEADFTEGGGGVVPVVVPVAEDFKPAPVSSASSYSEEEADGILPQCGRLSRSSSGNETRMGHRRWCSESKRSYDFDNERKGGEDEWAVSRSSPRTRTPGRDRSGSLEQRGSSAGGVRRTSRSPRRRSEVPASSCSAGETSRQPVKMVSVPAREKTWGSPPYAAANDKRWGKMGGPLRSGSPRSCSPANTSRTSITNENDSSHHYSVTSQLQSLSRSSSRKAEQSPYRRNPMAEIHVYSNSKLQKTRQGVRGTRKLTPLESSFCRSQKATENVPPMTEPVQRTAGTAVHTNTVKTSIVVTDCRTKQQKHMKHEVVEERVENSSLNSTEMVNGAEQEANTRVVLDLDHAPDLNPDSSINPTSYASSLLEDIHSYRHQHQNTAFALPACLSKAYSIIEAVAELSSTSSENKSSEADR